MRNMNGCKLATAVLVFTLLLSSLAILPGQGVEGAGGTYTISFNVTDTDYDPVINAEAALEEVHTGSIVDTPTDSSGLASFSPGQGYYKLTVTKSGYFDLAYPDIIRFTDLSNVNLGIIEMEKMPSLDKYFRAYVNETGTATPVDNVTLTVIDWSRGDVIYEGTASGYFDIPIFLDWYAFVFTAPGYAKEVLAPYLVTGNTTVEVEMDTSSLIRGYVYIDDGPVTSGLSAYLVSTNDSAIYEERIIAPRSVVTNTFVFDASDGEYWLVVDADGAQSNISSFEVNGSETISVDLVGETAETEAWDVDFQDDDWNELSITMDFSYNHDRTYPTMNYSYLSSIRMQVDFALGNGNGVVNQSEADAFAAVLETYGPWYVNTVDFLTVNDTAFVSSASGIASLSIDGLTGSVESMNGFTGEAMTEYDSIGTIDAEAPDYTAEVTVITGVQHVSDAPMERTYSFVLRDGYELVANETDDPDISVKGYTTVSVVPDVDMSWGTAQVEMEIESSKAPSAVAAIETGEFAYAEYDNDTLLYYIVREGKNVTFTSVGSYDPNGNPLTYQWAFGDGTVETVITVETAYIYDQSAFEVEVELTVIDVAGLTDEVTFKVRVDNVDPVPEIIVDGEEIPSGGTVDTDQHEPLVFDGSGSVDWINSTSDPEHGIIVSWHWDFGDGNSTTVVLEEDVTHAFEDAGTYTVTLNVTDAVGHYTDENITVNVADITPPVVLFDVLNSDFKDISEEAPIENETLYFNGSKTYDNYYDQSELDFVWDFGDDANATGINVTHSYAAVGSFTATLTVTDPANNTANKTMDITVTSSPRPDLRITSIEVEPSRFTEGESGKIMVNITNVGNDNATGIKATFYLMKADGSKEKLGESTDLTVDGASANLLSPDQSGIVTWYWTPSGKGNFTLYVVVEADREISTQDNHATVSIEVNEATWKAAAIYGGIFAVIVVVIVLLYFRKRLPWGASKAPAKTRKSKK